VYDTPKTEAATEKARPVHHLPKNKTHRKTSGDFSHRVKNSLDDFVLHYERDF
jgi:hypothetical protein